MKESDKPIVQLRNVTKKIRGKKIIDQLSFDVPRGEVFGFLGPNGAGKTTTIRMMVGLMSITEGEILIDGFSVSKNFEQAIDKVGAIVENPEMYKFLTGYQNLLHYARMRKGITQERIDEVVALVGLSNRIHEKVKTYSLGMRQRLGVAQAILHRPSLLILDEPTNGLDPAGIRELRDYLRKLSREENIAIVVSSHVLTEMELMCDKVAIIQNGRLIDVRTVKEDKLEGAAAVVQLEVEPLEKAMEIVKAFDTEAEVVIQEDKLLVTLQREDVPVLNARLVAADINVYGIIATTKSLEDVFLEMTGGDQIA